MADDEIVASPSTPKFADADLAELKALLGAKEEPDVNAPIEQPEQPVRRRGRPKGSKNRSTLEREAAQGFVSTPRGVEAPVGFIAPAPLTKRQEREVADRLSNILLGATGMGGMVKPYLPMTEEEAKAIAEPLASYLIRNEPTNGVAREILENYDILAMVMGVGAYGVRVYHDRREEVATSKPANTSATQRISDLPQRDNGRGSNEGDSPQISIADATRGGTTPFDI